MTHAKATDLSYGTKVKIDTVSCSIQGYGYEDEVYTITNKSKITETTRLQFAGNVNKSNYNVNNYIIYAKNVYVVSYSKEYFERDIKSLQEQIEEKQSIVEYLEATGLKEYDETQYKVYRTLQLLKKDNLTDMEKSVMIADLINK